MSKSLDIARLAAEGLSQADIARQLGVSRQTVSQAIKRTQGGKEPKRGRPSDGPRRQYTVRLPEAVAEWADANGGATFIQELVIKEKERKSNQ